MKEHVTSSLTSPPTKNPLFETCQAVSTVDFGGFETCQAVSTVDFGGFETCQAVSTVDFGGFETCQAVSTVDFGEFETCQAVSTVDFGGFENPGKMTLESVVTLFIGRLPYTTGFHNKHLLYCTQPMKLDHLDQCFSTFVRPRPGKFFFHKARARYQQIYS
jgi:hypothetical protein